MGTIKDKIILLVDDEPAILQMCQSILKENGFENHLSRRNLYGALRPFCGEPIKKVRKAASYWMPAKWT